MVAKIGQSVDPEKDVIKFSGNLVNRRQKYVYYVMNKPRGIETTCAQREGKSIVDIVDIPTRVFPIGRLDKDSSGLILLTNDGRITHRLLHPSFEHEKEYLVTTYGKIDDQALEQMSRGVRYTDNKAETINNKSLYQKHHSHHSFVQTQPCEIFRAGSDMFRIVLKEGKNRQIRRMVEACGYEVKKLKRIRIEHIELRDLPEGAYRELQRGEREELLRRSGLPLVEYMPIVGEVVHGNGRGHELGFPTANIPLSPGALPDETFSCRVMFGSEIFLGAGMYHIEKGHFEVHILDFNRDIYGKILHVEILDSIRKNQKFPSTDKLKEQIQKDIHHVRAHWTRIMTNKNHE